MMIPLIQRLIPGIYHSIFHPFYREMILWVRDAIRMLEKMVFYDVYYKAFWIWGISLHASPVMNLLQRNGRARLMRASGDPLGRWIVSG